MNFTPVDWATLKEFVTSRGLSVQWLDFGDVYKLVALDSYFALETTVKKTDPVNADQADFEANFKANGNKKIAEPRDSDGSPLQRVKITTSGWHYQLHGLEFSTSSLTIESKKEDGTNFGFTTIKCYDTENNLLTTQEQCDASAVKTIIDWEPNHDLEVIGGMVKQAVAPTEDIRIWVVGVPDVPVQYGGSKLFAANINLKYMGQEEGVRVDGRAPKYLVYNSVYHSNKLRLILKHPAGHKHPLHMIFEIFKA